MFQCFSLKNKRGSIKGETRRELQKPTTSPNYHLSKNLLGFIQQPMTRRAIRLKKISKPFVKIGKTLTTSNAKHERRTLEAGYTTKTN